MTFDFKIEYVKGNANGKINILNKKLNYKPLLKEIKLILKLINNKLKLFKLIKKVNINKVIKKVYKPRIKSYLKIIETIDFIKRWITFLNLKKKVKNILKTVNYIIKTNLLK